MKKTLPIMFAILILTSIAFAAPAGPVVSDRWGKTSAAIEWNHVFDQDLKPEDKKHQSFQVEEISQVYGVIAREIISNKDLSMNVYAKAGLSNLITESINDELGQTEHIEYDYAFLWGVGVNASKPIKDNVDLILDAQYSQWRPEFDTISVGGKDATSISGSKDVVVSEWQAALLLQTYYDYGRYKDSVTFAPFIGAMIHWLDIDTDDINYTSSAGSQNGIKTGGVSDDIVGLMLGAEVFTSQNLRIKVDGRLISEDALSISGHWEF